MTRPLNRITEYFAAEPVRVTAFLRLPLIGLIALLVWIWEVDHWLPGVYAVVLGLYAVAAVVWVIVVLRGPVPRWADWASTAVDVLVMVVLCLVSGGATAALLPVFFLLPISVAFQDRPTLTAILGTSTADLLFGGVDRLLQTRRFRRPSGHRVHALRFPDVGGSGHHRVVPRARAPARACHGPAERASPIGLRSDAGRRAAQPGSGRAPARRSVTDAARRPFGPRRGARTEPGPRAGDGACCAAGDRGRAALDGDATASAGARPARLDTGDPRNCCGSSKVAAITPSTPISRTSANRSRSSCCTGRRANCWPTFTSMPAQRPCGWDCHEKATGSS